MTKNSFGLVLFVICLNVAVALTGCTSAVTSVTGSEEPGQTTASSQPVSSETTVATEPFRQKQVSL